MPIMNTCKAHLEDIEQCLTSTLDDLDTIKKISEPDSKNSIKYSCIFKASNNGSISRDEIFKIVGKYMLSKNKANKVDFDKPDYVLLIHIVTNMCFLSFVRNYFEYRKYNLVEMGAKFIDANEKTTKKIEESLDKSEVKLK
jgi:tRNA acetyltransferase TAN1